MTCGNCEYFGNYQEYITSQDMKKNASGGWYYPVLDIDTTKGAYCACAENSMSNLHAGTDTVIYNNSRACKYFKQKEWSLPDSCINCEKLISISDEGIVNCHGYNYGSKKDTKPCANGRMHAGRQLKLF